MELPTLMTASLAGYLVLGSFLIPRAKERWRADRTPAVVAQAMAVAVLTFLRTLAGAALAASVAVLVALGAVKLAGGTLTRGEYASALEVVTALRGGLGWMSKTFSLICFALLCGALLYLTRRRAGRAMKEVYEESVRRELDRLGAEAAAHRWTQLEPTAEMLAVERQHAMLRAFSEAVADDDPEGSAKVEAARGGMAELEELWVRLDWMRRIDPKWEVDEPVEEHTSGWRRVESALVSKGMFRTTGDLSKGMSRVALLLLFLSLFGVQAGPLRAAVDHQAVRLSEIAVKADRKDAIASAAQERSAEPVDAEVLDEVARRFEQAFQNSVAVRGALRAAAGAAPRPVDFREMSVRRAILDAAADPGLAAAGGAEGLTQHPSMAQAEGLGPVERQALDAYAGSATEPLKPRTPVGRDVRRALDESGITRTGRWARLQADLRERRAEFHRLASIEDVGGDLVGEALGGVLDEFNPQPGTELGKLADRVRGKATSEAVKRLYEIKRDAFLADIARGVDVRVAVDRVLRDHPRYVALTLDNARTLHDAFGEVPRSGALAEKLDGRHPRLRWTGETPDVAQARALIESTTPPFRTAADLGSAVDFFASYEDFFPGQRGAASSTVRSRIIDSYVSAPGRHVAPNVVRELPMMVDAGDAMVDAATSFRRLSGFRRVGGVLLGQDPGRNPAVRFRDIGWQSAGDSVRLWLVESGGMRRSVGTFPAATVHQALAYAADDRRVAVTMTSAVIGGQPWLRILLHPALMDTPLGRDMVAIDAFVDEYARREGESGPAATVRSAVDDARAVHAVYRYAYLSRLRARNLTPQDQSEVAQDLADAEASAVMQARFARVAAGWPDISAPARSAIRAEPEFYDAGLVRLMDACVRASRTPASFGACIRQRASATDGSGDSQKIAHAETWSGVRELPFAPDPELRFMRPERTGAPLRFMIQEALESVDLGTQSGDEERNTVRDSTPWEYPRVAALVHGQVIRRVSGDREGTRVLRSVQEFAVLQRLFRTALIGGLGPGFRRERLVPLARETRAAVRRVPTPRASRGG